MIEKIVDWLIERRLKQSEIPILNDGYTSKETLEFRRVLNTLRRNKVMIITKKDGIYIRMAGNANKGECFSLEWGKVVSF